MIPRDEWQLKAELQVSLNLLKTALLSVLFALVSFVLGATAIFSALLTLILCIVTCILSLLNYFRRDMRKLLAWVEARPEFRQFSR